jgi:hypothetical protein
MTLYEAYKDSRRQQTKKNLQIWFFSPYSPPGRFHSPSNKTPSGKGIKTLYGALEGFKQYL